MKLSLKALSGPLKNQAFPVTKGLQIGRRKGQIRLEDAKVSSLHAFIEEDKGQFWLRDNGSKNGVRVQGQRTTGFELIPGKRFSIGESEFEVLGERAPSPEIELDAPELGLSSPAAPASPQANESPPAPGPLPPPEAAEQIASPEPQPPPTSPEKVPLEPLKWNEWLAHTAVDWSEGHVDQPKAVVALEPAIALNFTRGIQTETRWILGYGPRRIGSASVDLPLYEPSAPEISFEILPSPSGVTFRTSHPKQVTLNGQFTTNQVLKEGDEIVIGQTRIEVELLK